jgi:hypothetical protein
MYLYSVVVGYFAFYHTRAEIKNYRENHETWSIGETVNISALCAIIAFSCGKLLLASLQYMGIPLDL